VILAFSTTGRVNKGVDIRGRLGESVAAAADGVVVYAGGGLRGYGKLVIVKHNDHFLSAYGHNRAILVKEGEKVKGGQVVAEIGSSGLNQEMLHFEIRRDGKPEDPLLYLPDKAGKSD
jgi:lipoprotein NlpD